MKTAPDKKNFFIILVFLVILLAGVLFWFIQTKRGGDSSPANENLREQTENSTEKKEVEKRQDSDVLKNPIRSVAEDLEIPWEIVWISEKEILITERPGRIVRVNLDSGEKSSIEIPGVYHIGEGGLLGMALHPEFEKNRLVYLYSTYRDVLIPKNRIERYRLDPEENRLEDRRIIISDIPGSTIHNGGRIAFGPDGMLYAGTGDANSPENSQNPDSLAGKILRISDEGNIPTDNPFGNAVFSLGHRNPQGLAWDNQNRLWSSEHGPSGASTGFDEINLVERGKNYGWPEIRGDQSRTGMETPVIQSGGSETWAPGAVEIAGKNLFFVGLRGQTLYSAEIENGRLVNFKRLFSREFGRLRVVKAGSDGHLYIATSNRDGRGNPREGDDRILRINLEESE